MKLEVYTIPQFIQAASTAGAEGDFDTLDKLEYIANDWMIPTDERNALLSLIEMARLCAEYMDEQ